MEGRANNMVLRRFILFLLFLTVVFISTGVSFASDNNTTNVTNHTLVNNTIHKLTKNNTLPDPTNTRTGKHYTSIQTAINEAGSGDTITLETGTYYENLVIDRSINLIGAGKDTTIINGQQKGHVIYVYGGCTVTISGIAITNGLADRGGGIYNDGTLTMYNSSINGNTAPMENTESIGGGIYNVGTLTLQNSTVNGNTATGGWYVYPNYGAIDVDGLGGGIYNYGTLALQNSHVDGNTANGRYGKGGGIFNMGTITTLNSTISWNTAVQDGGGVDNHGILILKDSSIANNNPWGFVLYGGGIYNLGTVVLLNSTISGNNGFDNGGGIENEGGNVILYNSIVTGNALGDDGRGGYYGWNGGIDNSFGGTTYINNDHSVYGNIPGNINGYNLYSCLNLRSWTPYTTIQAAINGASNGDNILISLGTYHENLQIKKSINLIGAGKDRTVIDGGNYGPVIYIDSSATVNITGITIHNQITQYIYYGAGMYNDGNVTLKDSAITGNTVNGQGGGIYNNNDGILTLVNSQITGNVATGEYGGNGGGIYNAAGNITLINSIISGNVAYGNEWGGGYGGGIYNYGTVILYNSKITGNTATGNDIQARDGNYGGGIYNYWGSSVYADSLSYILYNNPDNYYDIWGDDIIPIPSLGGGLPPATSTNNSNSEINVSAASTVNSKTIGMQETGLPIVGLIMAILMVLGGLGRRRR